MSRQYYGIENLALNATQKQTLINALKQLGDNQNPNPSRRNHTRVRLDNDAIIFEALFADSDWTQDNLEQKAADIFGIDVNLISSGVNQTVYGPVITFTVNAIDRFRMVAFGGLLATYADSHAVVLQYLADNIAEWETEIS